MTNIDWSKAPEGATHYQPVNKYLRSSWIKIVSGVYWFRMKDSNAWSFYDGPLENLGELVQRPTAWTGEGLPPVGTVCEHQGTASDREWLEVKVIAHTIKKFHNVAVFEYGDVVAFSTKQYFRPFRTAEQIAADERMNAAKEFHSLVCPDGKWHKRDDADREAWATIYDAGYRKVAP